MKIQLAISVLALVLLTGCCKNDEPHEIITESEAYNDFGFSDISFADERVGYISTNYNIIQKVAGVLKTTDCGDTWQFYPVYVDNTPSSVIRSIYALSPDTIYATYASDINGVCKSVDGGVSWEELGNFASASAYGSIYFKNSRVGFVRRANAILKTTDGGITWESKYFGNVSWFTFTSSEVGYACGGSAGDYGSYGTLLKTTDGGDTWVKLPALTEYITSLNFVNDEVGYAFTFNNRLYKTTDGGQSWALHNTLPGGLYFTAAVTGGVKYFAAESRIYKSTNDFKGYNELYVSQISNEDFHENTVLPSKNTVFFITRHTIVKITQS